jgi:hypothetical protein
MDDITSSNNEGQEGQGQEAGAQDPVKNLKSEVSRKFDNISEQLRTQAEQMQAMLSSLQAAKSTPAAPVEEPDPIVDPVAFKARIKEEAKSEIRSEINLSQATQSEIMRLQAMYPEFGENDSKAAKIALQKFQSLNPALKGTPEGAKLVMMETAAELGLIPASRRRRSESEDDYTVGGSPSAAAPQRGKQTSKKVDDLTLAFASYIGIDVNDQNTRKELEKYAQRDRWGKWEGQG